MIKYFIMAYHPVTLNPIPIVGSDGKIQLFNNDQEVDDKIRTLGFNDPNGYEIFEWGNKEEEMDNE